MTPLIYIPLIVMVFVYSLMIVKVNWFIGTLRKSVSKERQRQAMFASVSTISSSLQQQDECACKTIERNHFWRQPPLFHPQSSKHGKICLTKQKITAHKHRRSIMITIFVYCIIAILFWLPLQSKLH